MIKEDTYLVRTMSKKTYLSNTLELRHPLQWNSIVSTTPDGLIEAPLTPDGLIEAPLPTGDSQWDPIEGLCGTCELKNNKLIIQPMIVPSNITCICFSKLFIKSNENIVEQIYTSGIRTYGDYYLYAKLDDIIEMLDKELKLLPYITALLTPIQYSTIPGGSLERGRLFEDVPYYKSYGKCRHDFEEMSSAFPFKFKTFKEEREMRLIIHDKEHPPCHKEGIKVKMRIPLSRHLKVITGYRYEQNNS